jgi:peptidoglycan/xylan/chitin deacetylase (PgdA/CDA1 family)
MALRIDRLATLYLAYPLMQRHLRKGIHIPILMYHSISDDREDGVHPYYRLNTSPDIFASHMRFLYENNYSAISLDGVYQQLASGERPDNKLVAITFDDGYRDFYTQAFPVLQRYHYTATVFLPTGFIDNKELRLKGKEHLNWYEIQELHHAGIKFGSHTVTHPQLRFLKSTDVEFELRQSKETIEDKLGAPVNAFSYPFAFPEEDKEFTEYLRDILQKSGYKCGVSTRVGTTSIKDDILFLKRIPVNSCDDTPLLEAKLEGAYNWFYKSQYLFKMAKRILTAKNL